MGLWDFFRSKIPSSCTIHILDPKGNRSERWAIGVDGVPPKTYGQLKDSKGDLFALVVYEKGEPRMTIISKDYWLQAQAQFAQIEKESEEAMNTARKSLGL